MGRGEKCKGVMNTLLISWQHCSFKCNYQTIWNTLDFETTEHNGFGVIRISCPPLYSLSPRLWSSSPPNLPGFSLEPFCSRRKEVYLWYFSCSFLFSPLMDRDVSPILLQRKWIRAGLLCYNVWTGEYTPVKQCVSRNTVGDAKCHQNHH